MLSLFIWSFYQVNQEPLWTNILILKIFSYELIILFWKPKLNISIIAYLFLVMSISMGVKEITKQKSSKYVLVIISLISFWKCCQDVCCIWILFEDLVCSLFSSSFSDRTKSDFFFINKRASCDRLDTFVTPL